MRFVRRGVPVVAALFIAFAAVAQPRVRMNIDDQNFDLEHYKIAVQVLMDRDKDPTHKDDPVNWLHNGYNYFANLHDFFDTDQSGCIHGSEVFLPWHRELLYRFELAIRAAKPGVTDNLTIPYWDWTQKPSGVGYPKAFEDPTSVLYRAIRNRVPTYFYDASTIESVIVDTQDWVKFAGRNCTLKPNCSAGENCAICPAFKYGALEEPYHNNMHVGMGPTMKNPSTAVKDPVFWSFHAFIDHIYQRWQCAHQKLPVCLDCNFRGMTDRKVRDVIDIERQLNYVYDNIPSCTPEPALFAAATAARSAAQRSLTTVAAAEPVGTRERRIALSAAANGPKKKTAAVAVPSPLGPHVFALTIPDEGFKTADLIISGLPVSTAFSYSGRVFLYPAAAAFKPDDADFTRRYKVGEIGVWARPPEGKGAHAEHGGDATAVVDIDLVHALRYLSHAEHGAAYRIAILFNPPDPLAKAPEPGAIDIAAASQEIHFTSVELVLDETRE